MQKEKVLRKVKMVWKTNGIKMLDKLKNNKTIVLFVTFLIFYITIGVQVSSNVDLKDVRSIIFNTDTPRVIDDMTDIFVKHYRLTVHPLFVILTQPIYFILSGITQSKMLAIIIMSALASSISVTVMYKIFQMFSKSEKMNLFLSICYGISFSCLIFTADAEVYNYATMFLILLWYFVIKKLKEGWNKHDFVTLIALGVASFSVTVTNFAIFLIACLVLAISKTVKVNKIILIDIVTIIVCVLINIFQHCIWQNTPMIINFANTVKTEQTYTDYNVSLNSIQSVIENDLYNSIAASDIHEKVSKKTGDKWLNFTGVNLENIIVISLFLLTILVFIIKNFKKNDALNFGLILALFFNCILHVLYGNTTTFLYSMHFTYLIFILFAINCLGEENKKIKKVIEIVIILLFVLEIMQNSRIFLQILHLLIDKLPASFFLSHFGIIRTAIATTLIATFLIVIIIILYYFMKKLIKSKESSEKSKYLIFVIIFVILFESTFVLLQTVSKYENFLGKSIASNSKINIITSKDYNVFRDKYKEEVESYLQYVEDYKSFIEKYNCKISNDIPNIDFYLFGMGNRRKLLYKEGKLIDIETKEVVQTFDVKNCLIVPNEYCVLIKSTDGKYTKIFENEDGVFIESKIERKLVEGTNVYVKLHSFMERTYKSIKKVLYSEILFNIKNGSPYSNILVYDKPGDEEITKVCVAVLQQTENTELIKNYKLTNTEIQKESLTVNNKLYPLTWEKGKEQENYIKTDIIDKSFVETKISPTNLLKASKMILFLLDKTEYIKIYEEPQS